jgi:ATP-dependent Clp protease ATP-binding subunit ClpC
MSSAQSLEVLRALAAHDKKREPDRAELVDEALVPIVELAERYLPYEAFPGKAARLYDDVRASHELSSTRPSDGKLAPIRANDVFEHFSVRTGIPTFLLLEDRTLRLETIQEHFDRRLVGQEQAKRVVGEAVCVVKAGLQPSGKPLASFLFVGPTGVGKTELARALSELLFGSADRLVRFDMSEYTDPFAAERLIRGTERGEGLLTRQVREQPFCVILLDEIEKAHPAVFDLLLQVCGEGRLTDGRGKTAYFHNAILIMTSNLGAAHRRATVGFEARAATDVAYYTKEVDKTFRPEFVNRLDRIVAFRSLTFDEMLGVARLAVERVKTRRGIVQRQLELQVSEPALELLAADGFSDAYGARALRRYVDEHLVNPIGRLLCAKPYRAKIDLVDVRTDADPAPQSPGTELGAIRAGGLLLTAFAAPRAPAKPMTSIWDVSGLRREMQRQMRFDRVTAVKAQIDYLVAQLSYGEPKKGRERASEIGPLSAEHHRLLGVWTALDGVYQDVLSAEELAFAAFFARESFDALLEEARAAKTRFRTALFDALVCRDPRRHAITMIVQELDDGCAFDAWLAPMLATLKDRGWHAEIHLDGEKDPKWPDKRRWGPPRDADYVLDVLARPDRELRNLLLRVRGPNAGIILGLEGGVHRFHGTHPDVSPAHLKATRVAFRASVREKDWTPPVLNPSPPGEASVAKRQMPAREILVGDDVVKIMSGRASLKVPLAEYWPRIQEIALEHLLLFETNAELDRDAYLSTTFTEDWDDVADLARSGQKIEAIKLYRERTGAGLKESKDYVESLG